MDKPVRIDIHFPPRIPKYDRAFNLVWVLLIVFCATVAVWLFVR